MRCGCARARAAPLRLGRQHVPLRSGADRRHPGSADPASCYLQTIQFENGTRMDRYGQYVKAAEGGGLKEVRGAIRAPNLNRPARRPSGEPNIAGEWAPEQVVMADPRGTGGGLVPLSTIAKVEAGQGAQPNQGGGRGRGAAPAGPRLYGGTELTELGTINGRCLTHKDNPRFLGQTTTSSSTGRRWPVIGSRRTATRRHRIRQSI